MDALKPPPSFQSWVPHCIAETIWWQFDSFTRDIAALKEQRFGELDICEIARNAQTILDRFYRLASRSDMQGVWRRLSDATPKLGSIESFLTNYAHIASYPGQPEAFWKSVPSLQEQRERLGQIADLAEKLSQKLGPIIPFPAVVHTAWLTLNVGVDALNASPKLRDANNDLYCALLRLQERNRGLHRSIPEPEACALWLIGSQTALAPLEHELAALKMLAHLSTNCLKKPPKGGVKRYTRITISRLAGLIDRTLASPYSEEIATTVTVALDLPEPIDEAYVRQVRNAINRKKPA